MVQRIKIIPQATYKHLQTPTLLSHLLSLEIDFLNYIYLNYLSECVCVYVCACVTHVYVLILVRMPHVFGCPKKPESVLDPLELEL